MACPVRPAANLRSAPLAATPARVRSFHGKRVNTRARASASLEEADMKELSKRMADVATNMRLQLLLMLRAKMSSDVENGEIRYLSQRLMDVARHFPTALGMDDFLMRSEVALCSHGFRGDNSIACTNLCRDESTGIFKQRIDALYGSSFNINGLGGVLTCGCVGIGAGLSHSPICSAGKERYVFFSFPHIAIDSDGNVGKIHRPGRAGESSACGALIASLSQMKASGVEAFLQDAGTHDALDPEFSILKQRLARRVVAEGLNIQDTDLAQFTALAERVITSDLQTLIDKAVDTDKADYAVITGVHVHGWENEGSGAPTLEFIAPTQSYVVCDGQRTDINLTAVPALTPRQMMLLSANSEYPTLGGAFLDSTTVIEAVQTDPAARRPTDVSRFDEIAKVPEQLRHEVPGWTSTFVKPDAALEAPTDNM